MRGVSGANRNGPLGTEARQRKRAANQEAGDKAEQGNNTEAGQRMRAEIRERAKTGIQPQAPGRPIKNYSPSQELFSGIHGSGAKQGP